MPKKNTAPFTPPEGMDQATADDLAALHETNPDLFPDRGQAAEEAEDIAALKAEHPGLITDPEHSEDSEHSEEPRVDPETGELLDGPPAEPDFVIVDGEPEKPAAEKSVMEKAQEILGLYAMKKAVVQYMDDLMGDDKEEVLDALNTVWKESGATTYEVKVPTVDGERVKIAQAKLMAKDAEVKVDNEELFTDWLVRHHPELVRVKHHPAEPPVPAYPAWDEEVPAPDALDVVLENAQVRVREVETERGTKTVREMIDPATGDVIPGLRHVPARPPESMRLSWLGPGSPGKVKALELLFAGRVQGFSLAAAMPTPEIGQ